MRNDLLFAYGTLQKGFSNRVAQYLSQHSRIIGTGYMIGRLYEVNGYPGAIQTAARHEKIYGSIFQLYDTTRLFPVLDQYEECGKYDPQPYMYSREKVKIFTGHGERMDAWAYIYNLDVSTLSQIKSGNYLQYRKMRNCSK